MAVEAELLSLADVRAAADRIRPHVVATPTISGEAVAGTGVWLKAENLQRTGSFKARGAVNAVLQLSVEQRRRGVITLSAGNHGLALAYAAQIIGIPCLVVVREDAPLSKLEAIRRLGAEIVLTPIARWQERLEAEQRERNLHRGAASKAHCLPVADRLRSGCRRIPGANRRGPDSERRQRSGRHDDGTTA